MTLRLGDVFANRFYIDRVAGSGGMGTVYRARDQLSSDWVALKLLHDQGSARGDEDRFVREAQILSELRHPGIVAYVAHGLTPQGQRFLVMQWLDGEDLAQRLSRGPLSLSDTLTLTGRVTEALAFAHAQGVIHRDLKPTNLFLPSGDISQLKILDFGVARRLIASRALTRTGVLLGTPEYMAPEQARGARQLTPAADLFSLGCILYECLTGEPPFIADHIAAVLARILFEEPTPVEKRRPGIPASVRTLLSRLLEKDPERRIGDAVLVTHAVAEIKDLPGLPFLETLEAPVTTTPTPSGSEQVLLSLVLAISPQGMEPGSSTMLSADVVAEVARHGILLATLRELGAQADILLNGALVITVPQLPSAQDQAAQAARLASLVKDHWPEAQVAVVTGKGSRSRGGLTGEVLDRAWRLLGNPKATPPASPAPLAQIRVDHVSAGLLQTRFELSSSPAAEEGYVLGGELFDADAGRLLLGKPTPCLGRERELATLEAVYSECKEELVARAVLVVGQPGLGKSRLRHEFVRRLSSHGAQGIVLVGRGDPMKVKSAYGILGEALRKQWDVREGQDPAEQRARIKTRIAAMLPESEASRVAMFLGEVCGVPFPDDESPKLRAARQDPRIMADQVERAWLDGLQLLRSEEPLLLILEDLHWSDALTIKLVGAALRRLRDHAFMVLALARPEVHDMYPNMWTGTVQLLQLHPLPRRAGERLVRQILGPDVSSAELARIIEQSTGNPLFLEELIRAAAERQTGALSETVIAMLQARIGRLSANARRVLRAASVFGEMFWESGVVSLLAATRGEDRTPGALESLVQEEIIEKISEGHFADETQYRFRHALVRDAAYDLTSQEERLAWHAAAGKFLEGIGEREVILLADHYRLGGELSRAVKCYARAGEQAYDAGNMDAALACIERGLGCGAAGEDRGELLSLQCLIKAFREQYEQILATGREAISLLRPDSKPACQVIIPVVIATMYVEPDKLSELTALLLRMQPQQEALPMYCSGITLLTILAVSMGQKAPGSLMLQRAQSLHQSLADKDHNAWGWYWLAEAHYNHFIDGLPHTCIIDYRKARYSANEASNRQLHASATAWYGKALADLGQRADALPVLRSGLRIAEQTNDELILATARGYLADQLAERLSPDDGQEQEAIELALLIMKLAKHPLALGMAHSVLARLAEARGELEDAEIKAREACQLHATFPAYKAESAALWSRILRRLGRDAEALHVCEDAVQEQTALGIEPYALLALYVELSEARARAGQPESARDAIAHALPILKKRIDDIPDPDMRATYLREVPANVRLLELARKWGIDTSALDVGD
ncbi:MAG TPA: protein kinase [Polyangiaceae bacterium]|nr:protein kinase [Polyangiaceae bacterium]